MLKPSCCWSSTRSVLPERTGYRFADYATELKRSPLDSLTQPGACCRERNTGILARHLDVRIEKI